ncbi:hypothetical protein GF389_02545, partial [Candidatus Dojkabacteria bacterium]|nr:hypothetical protein [Candidatus Dojkabacteria bacterium]
EVIVEEIIENLKKRELLNDKEFAKWFIKLRLNQGKKSRLKTKQDLIQKGVKEADYIEHLETIYTDPKENQILEKLVEKKLKLLDTKDLTKQEKEEKVKQYLIRKGFLWDSIKNIKI